MTFLTTRFRLTAPLTAKDFTKLPALSTVYGIRGLDVEGNELMVEYDASRIHEAEVLAAVRGAGLPVEPAKPILPGGVDYSGEFKDFAWPTSGISPANKPQK